eukprot:753299-Hanusia_phi.AAC.10
MEGGRRRGGTGGVMGEEEEEDGAEHVAAQDDLSSLQHGLEEMCGGEPGHGRTAAGRTRVAVSS